MINVVVIILSLICLWALYDDWYREVYAIKSFSIELTEISITQNQRPVLHLKFNMSTKGDKGVEVLMIVYNVYRDSTLIRQISQNFPQGLKIIGSRLLTKSMELPKNTPLDCFSKGKCYVVVQMNIKTRFGVVPVKYLLNP